MSQAPVLADHYQGEDKKFAEATAELNRRVDEGTSWSGKERNKLFLNVGKPNPKNHIPDFADVSSVAGFDFPDDSRAIVPIDWDFDGDLDFVVSNRNAPRVRIFENRTAARAGSSLAIRLVGSGSNRDAIGSRVEIDLSGGTVLQRTLHGGQGFLSQAGKWLHFGIPDGRKVTATRVFWNSADAGEAISGITAGSFWTINEGAGAAEAWTATAFEIDSNQSVDALAKEPTTTIANLARPIPLPSIPYTDSDGAEQTLAPGREGILVVNLWATWCAPCVAEFKRLHRLCRRDPLRRRRRSRTLCRFRTRKSCRDSRRRRIPLPLWLGGN